MGLVQPIELPDPATLSPVHFIAIGGSGMNGIASAMLQLGLEVSGSDRQDSKYLQGLQDAGARTYIGHRAEQLGDARTVVASSAIREDNPELAAARERGLTVLHRSAALGSLMLGRRGIAVAGTHGKTTTTAMIAHVLTACEFDPSYVIGGALTGTRTGGHIGGGREFVVEADESDGSFLQYPREIAVVTNVDPDHLVNWGTPQNYADGFVRFAAADMPSRSDAPRRQGVRLLVVSADEPGAVALTEAVRVLDPAGLEIVTFGEAADADVRITDLELAGTGSRFTLTGRTPSGSVGGPVELSVPGRYNAWNAAATYAVVNWLGAPDHRPEARIRDALRTYGGTHRRFELVGTVDGIRVYDDYAHHPTEVANTLRAARTGVGDGRVVVCFQPHLYTRTRDFWRELASAMELADEAIVMDVCGDREDPIPGVDGALVADAVAPGTAHVTYEPVWDRAAPVVAGIARPGDLVITVGCGDVTKVAPKIVDELRRREAPATTGETR
ncbi:UDP-N-acetylmuramate--L-alanine ligase [Microlunatus ginsengisoli]|uniref:UDP-N-acetylmuramate--L-alanine ligase n=1 Tax=Microlunatus ginsengisoli TaxID=363863 RepID=A0ABP7ABA4_9ACTN